MKRTVLIYAHPDPLTLSGLGRLEKGDQLRLPPGDAARLLSAYPERFEPPELSAHTEAAPLVSASSIKAITAPSAHRLMKSGADKS